MWLAKYWSRTARLGNVLTERDFQLFLTKELRRLGHRSRVLNVACLELLDVDVLERDLTEGVLNHVTQLLAGGLRKRDVLAHTTENQLALFLPDSSPEDAYQLLSHMQLEVQGAMQLYHLNVSINISLYSFDQPRNLFETTHVVDMLLNEAKALGKNIMLHEVAVRPKAFNVPFTVRPSQFDKASKLV
jgi:GGDEF domain-containing protein